MKKIAAILIIPVVLIISILGIYYFERQIGNYNIIFESVAFLPQTNEKILIVGYEAKDLFSRVEPKSYLEIFKLSRTGKSSCYRFSPIVPEVVGYPRALMLEKAEIIKLGSGELFIVSSFGETGADYWGTHPIVIGYKDGSFRAASFYKGELSNDPRIKRFFWTRKDFDVKNRFDLTEQAKTILTQGVSVTKNQIELSFYGDNKPHAAEHSLIRLRFDLTRQVP